MYKSDSFDLADGSKGTYYPLRQLAEKHSVNLERLPYTIRVLLESAMRNHDDFLVTENDVSNIMNWTADGERMEIPFLPSRVILQDFTGVPSLVDVAAMRNAMLDMDGDPNLVNPLVPVDLVIDHSVQVDYSGRFEDALERNLEIEYKRNSERYSFLKWGQKNVEKFRVVPPGRGIVHQVNLEWIAEVVQDSGKIFFPDTVVGTDSHTTMINGLGVLGWGVGGIEAEAVMLGQPIYMLLPDVVGFEMVGKPNPGITATDLVLAVTEVLRENNVVGKFVEFTGDGVRHLSLPDKATISNMCPEYGATCGFFPIDQTTIDYLTDTGRESDHVKNVKNYLEKQQLFEDYGKSEIEYTKLIKFDISKVEPSLAGPKRPQDRIALKDMKDEFQKSLTSPVDNQNHGLKENEISNSSPVKNSAGDEFDLDHGDVVIAAITSCTNTSNPEVMIAAGLVAKKAKELGLKTKPWVKTSLAPGSRVVTEYLESSNLMEHLSYQGFNIVGYGCTTCIGNSGPLDENIVEGIEKSNLIVSSVISGNRNFEGRIHSHVKANFLGSPPLVVAYAIAGTVNINLDSEPIGKDMQDNPVFLKDIWPTKEEILEMVNEHIKPETFIEKYSGVTHEEKWDSIESKESPLFQWDENSTYIKRPSFLKGISTEVKKIQPIENARALLYLGDSVTTDHISPAGAISPETSAAKYLRENNVSFFDFNSYGSRRGNHEVMVRGTFANVRIRNKLVEKEGGFTKHFDSNETMTVFEAAQKYKEENTPLVVIAGDQYGTGSSRDWAAKGTNLLGVRAVIATGFERIHRSNLVGMGVLPLCFTNGENAEKIGITGSEKFTICGIEKELKPGQKIKIKATRKDGSEFEFQTKIRLDTPVEIEYYRNGGILPTVLRKMIKND